MNKFFRISTMVLLGAALLVGFGCCTKSVQPGPEEEVVIVTPDNVGEAISAIEGNLIHFAFDRYDLDSRSQQILQNKAAILKEYPQISATIEGHTDERGTEEYNLALGERRAQAAYDYLVMQGVSTSQLSTVSYGKLRPLDTDSNETAWALNRRAAFKAIAN